MRAEKALFRAFRMPLSGTSARPDNGHVEAQYQLGTIYLNGARPGRGGPDNWFKSASQRDDEAAQRNLNTLFPNGIAVEKNLDVAISWMLAAARNGKAEAQNHFGRNVPPRDRDCSKIISLPVTGICWRQSKAMRPHSSVWATSTIRALALPSTIRLAPIGTKRLPTKATPGRWSRSLLSISRAVAGRPIERRRRGFLFKRRSRVKRVACTMPRSCI